MTCRRSLPLLAAVLLAAACERPAAADGPDDVVASAEEVVMKPDCRQRAAITAEAAVAATSPPLHRDGRLAWDDDVTVRVFTPFAGRVAAIAVDSGQEVVAGAVLATISSADFGQAQAAVRKAQADLAQAERTADRLRDLFAHGAVPQKDVIAADADRQRAVVERDRVASQLARFGGGGDAIDQVCPLTTPIAGIVVDKNINPGQEVRPDQMLASMPQLAAPLFTISDPRRLWVQIDARETDLPLLHAGQPIAVRTRALPGRTFAGTVALLADTIDPATRMVRVRGRVDNPDRLLKAEMFVEVEFAGGASPGVAVPARAVHLLGERHVLWAEPTPGRYVRRAVHVGAEHEGWTVVDGVQVGDRVVTGGGLLLEQLRQARN